MEAVLVNELEDKMAKRITKKSSGKKWIQKAIKSPGSLTRTASKARGGITKSGKISKSFIQKASKSKNPTLRKRATLAKTLSGFKK